LKSTTSIGRSGEDEAIVFLIAHGFHIETTNYRYGRSEIDIIAKKGNLLVFIEVKKRKNSDFGYPESFLTDSQQSRIVCAAEDYILDLDWKGNVRFDIISIDQDGIQHLEDAFH